MEPPRHWFARPLTSRGDFASAPASLQACFPTYTVRSCDPLSLPQARPRTQLPSPSDWQTAPGTARGCMDLPGHTRAHACTRKGVRHVHAGPCSHRHTRSHKQTHTHTLQAQPTLTLNRPPPPCRVSWPFPPDDPHPCPGHSHRLTLTHAPSHTPHIVWAPTVGAGGAGSGREKTRDSTGEEGCGGCAGEGNDSPRSP